MSFTVSLSRKSEKFVGGLRDTKLRGRIVAMIDALAVNPKPPGSKQLTNTDRIHRVRVGDYRILYTIDEDRLTVLVADIGHRREIYG